MRSLEINAAKLIEHKHKKTRPYAILIVVVMTGLTAFAQLMLKLGSAKLSLDIFVLLTNVPLIIGAVTYIISAFIFIIALKYGELSILYPIIALSYVWVNFLSSHYLGETLNFFKWMGIGSILIGVWLIGWGSSK